MVSSLPGGDSYDGFAYDVGVLLYFLGDGQNPGGTRSQTGSNRQARRVSGTGSISGHRGALRGSLRGSFRGKALFKRRPSGSSSSNHSSGAFGRSSSPKGDASLSNSRGKSKEKPPLKRSLSR